MLSESLKNSRKKRGEDEQKFIEELETSQKACLQK
jgi:hypothetical protein